MAASRVLLGPSCTSKLRALRWITPLSVEGTGVLANGQSLNQCARYTSGFAGHPPFVNLAHSPQHPASPVYMQRSTQPPSFLRPKALFLDACGTFLIPAESVPEVYSRYAEIRGVKRAPDKILQGFRRAYNTPPDATTGHLRYKGDARDFWKRVVFESLDTHDTDIFEDIYNYYSRPEAWVLATGLRDALLRIRNVGVKICVVSNFDERLRPILDAMKVGDCFDAVVVSCEVGAEKPCPAIFDEACRRVNVNPEEDFVLHVGDDRRNDVWGARSCNISAWLWGEEIHSFEEIADRIVTGYTAI